MHQPAGTWVYSRWLLTANHGSTGVPPARTAGRAVEWVWNQSVGARGRRRWEPMPVWPQSPLRPRGDAPWAAARRHAGPRLRDVAPLSGGTARPPTRPLEAAPLTHRDALRPRPEKREVLAESEGAAGSAVAATPQSHQPSFPPLTIFPCSCQRPPGPTGHYGLQVGGDRVAVTLRPRKGLCLSGKDCLGWL